MILRWLCATSALSKSTRWIGSYRSPYLESFGMNPENYSPSDTVTAHLIAPAILSDNFPRSPGGSAYHGLVRVGDRQKHVLALLDPLNVHVNDLQLRRIDLIVG